VHKEGLRSEDRSRNVSEHWSPVLQGEEDLAHYTVLIKDRKGHYRDRGTRSLERNENEVREELSLIAQKRTKGRKS